MKLLLLLITGCGLAAGQLKFETASVKKSAQRTFETSLDPGLVSLKGIPLQPVVLQAFKIKPAQLEGAPSWTESPSDCFDIIGKMPEGATPDQLPELLRTLLAERFHLTYHKDSRQKPGYALVVDKGGSKLKEDDPAANFMPAGRGTAMMGRSGVGKFKTVTNVAGLANYLTGRLGTTVEDHTGLTAKYDIDLSWTSDQVAVAPSEGAGDHATDPGIDLATALRETLGLRLEKQTVTVEFVVIDHIERVPTGN
jgi:uncharacterized protein (TIGR03435 family)